MSCIEVPRPASGAAPPRWHTTWSILPNRRPTQASQSDTIGISKIHCIIPGMSPSRRIDPASVAIQVFLPGYAVLATISCGEIRPEHSTRTDTLPLSPDSMRCPSGASVKSVEQPCGHPDERFGYANLQAAALEQQGDERGDNQHHRQALRQFGEA